MTQPQTQLALLSFRTWNIGDEIQSLAARQYMPRIDAYLDRDRIAQETANLARPTKLIMNGWWLHGSDWPPATRNLQPLLTSMFFDHQHPLTRQFLMSTSSRAFLKDNGPVGA